MISRFLAGIAVSLLIALVAWRTRSLSPSGGVAAVVIGSLAVTVSWTWGALLVVYFVMASALSRIGAGVKAERTAPIIAKAGPRDAVQVLANGGAFAVAAAFMLVRPSFHWIAFAVGSLAASAADTWATEIGTFIGGAPRSILTLRRVPTGTSGGVTLVGTAAALAGAAVVAVAALLLGAPRYLVVAAAIGGIAGAVVDSLLGATVQARRWCPACGAETERRTHNCGVETGVVRGLAWLDNDVVNFVSTVVGGLLAAALTG